MRGDLCLLDALHAKRALLHHPAHANGDVRILLQLHYVRCALGCKRREIFFVDAELAGDFLFADRPLVVIEENMNSDDHVNILALKIRVC